MTNLKDLDWNDNIPHSKYKGKTVKMAIDADGKDAVLYLLKKEIPLTDSVINEFGIHRVVRDERYYNSFVDPFERERMRDAKVYKKETASKEKILKEILTLDNVDTDTDYKNEKDDVDLLDAVAETIIDESSYNE